MRVLEDLPSVRIGEMRRAGWLAPGGPHEVATDGLIASVRTTEGSLEVVAAIAGDETATFSLTLHRLPRPFGGPMLLFGCPDCERRVTALFWFRLRFCCRHCVGLPYNSQRWSSGYTRKQRVADLFDRLQAKVTPQMFERPKYVQAATWRRVLSEVERRMLAETV
jgi:hypothetical protein